MKKNHYYSDFEKRRISNRIAAFTTTILAGTAEFKKTAENISFANIVDDDTTTFTTDADHAIWHPDFRPVREDFSMGSGAGASIEDFEEIEEFDDTESWDATAVVDEDSL